MSATPKVRTYEECVRTEEHQAHMDVNDECPWCCCWREGFGQPIRRPDDVKCEEHGWTKIVDGGSTPGFTGAPITWLEYACGCTKHDDSADTLERVR